MSATFNGQVWLPNKMVKMGGKGRERREASPSPTLLVPSTCPRHRPPPSPSSPVVGARMPRPWLPHLRLRALARLGRRHPCFAAYGAVVAQLQPQPRGERRRPVPCLSGPASAPAHPRTRRPSNPEPPGHNGSGPTAPVTPSSRRRQTQRPAVGWAAGVPKSLAIPPQLPVRFMQVLDRLHAEARRPGGAQRPPGARCAPSPPARLPGPFGRRAGATGCPREPRHRPPGSPGRPSGLAGWPRPQEGVSRGQGLRPDPEPRAPPLVYR